MATSLNPFAQEWRPQGPLYSPIFTYVPPQPVVGFPPIAGVWHHLLNQYNTHPQRVQLYIDQAHFAGYTDGSAAVKKAAPGVSGRRKELNKNTSLPPRLRETRRSKMWRPKAAKHKGPAVAEEGEHSTPVAIATTLMIKNIPNQFRRDTFISFIDKYCLEDHLEYDFLYLPMDFKTNNNVGYAFVNLTTAAAAAKIRERLQDYRWGVLRTPSGFLTSKKVCDVAWARIQGKKELVKHFQKSNFVCATPDYLPAVFSPPRNGSPDSAGPQPIGNLMGNVRTQCK